MVKGNLSIVAGDDLQDVTIIGQSAMRTNIIVEDAAIVNNCEIMYANVSGVLDGSAMLRECKVENLEYVTGYMMTCGFGELPITLGGDVQASILDCYSVVAGNATPTIDMNGAGQALAIRNYAGGIRIRNRTGTDACSVDMASGHVIIDATCTGDPIILRGAFKLTVEPGATEPITLGRTAQQGDLLELPTAIENAEATMRYTR